MVATDIAGRIAAICLLVVGCGDDKRETPAAPDLGVEHAHDPHASPPPRPNATGRPGDDLRESLSVLSAGARPPGPPGSSRAEVRVDGEKTGAPTPGDVEAVIRRRYLRGVERCHTALLERVPGAQGEITGTFTVDATGNVSPASFAGVDDDAAACVKALVDRWRLPAATSANGATAKKDFEITVTLSFWP